MSVYMLFFFFKQEPAYEMRISDWSSDVCSSDLDQDGERGPPQIRPRQERDIIVEEMAGHKAGRGVFRIYIIGKARAERILQHRKEHQSGHAVKIGRASCRERESPYV